MYLKRFIAEATSFYLFIFIGAVSFLTMYKAC